jgi:hypothetical protein
MIPIIPSPISPLRHKDVEDGTRYLDQLLKNRDTNSSQFGKSFERGVEMLKASSMALYANANYGM